MDKKENNFVMTFNLMDLLGAEIITREGDEGGQEKGVFIPLERNNLRVGYKNRVYLYFYITPMVHPDTFGNTHYVKVKSPKTFVDRLIQMGYKGTPIVGRMRHDWAAEKRQRILNSKNDYVQEKVKIEEYEQPQ